MEVELLILKVMNKPRSFLYSWPEHELNAEQQGEFQALLERRRTGEPLAYILGQREFWSLTLAVSPATLIPRAETETLVEQALKQMPPQAQVLDLGTGSGAIALALKSERPDARVVACDVSEAALAVAQGNGQRLGLEVEWLHSDWFSAVPVQAFDVIVANPPYIAADDEHLQRGDLPFEPQQALSSGADGLDALRQLIVNAPAFLGDGAWLWLEHGYDQAQAVAELLHANHFSAVSCVKDLAQNERISGGQWQPSR